jgi:hypothetical protein
VVGISESSSLTLLIILNAVGIPGRIIPAFLADAYFGAFNVLIPFVGGGAVMLYAWAGVNQPGAFYTFVTLYGICANAVQTLFPSTLSLLTTGPPLAGRLIDMGNGSYLYAQVFGGSSMAVGCVFLGAARLCQFRKGKE